MSTKRYATAPHETERMPPGIPYIVGNEAAERFSFYGMKAILTVFMTQYLINSSGALDPLSPTDAKIWMANFVSAVYLFPIIGAVLSDWLLGKYRVILWLSCVYCVGHIAMALVDIPQVTGIEPRTMLAIALGLIAVGSGGIKPCVSSHVGDQFGRQNQHLLPRVFQWFYFSINFGSTISTFLTPLLLFYYGPAVAFGVPGVLMGIATLTFWLGRNKFAHIPPAGSRFFQETFSSTGMKAVLSLAPVFVLLAPFWALFDQTASAWVIQAESMNRNVFGFNIMPSQVQVVNPILVMLYIPLFSYVLYPFAGRYVKVTPLRRIGVGLFLAASSFMISAWIESRIEVGEVPHIIWQVVAYMVLTAAEILVSITALEFSYTQAPKRMKSLVMGLYLLSIALGNQVVAAVNRFIKNPDGSSSITEVEYYWVFIWISVAGAIIFAIYSQFYRGQTYIQDDELSRDAEAAL